MTDEELIARLREKTVKKLPNNWQEGRKCPDCGSDATRPKCFFDYGPSCVRHDPDAYDPPAWDVVLDPLSSAAADRIEALVKDKERLGREVNMARYGQPDFAWAIHNEAMAELQARAERLEAALRAIQTYLQEPAPENKLNDLKNDLRWIGNRARAALKGESHD